MLQLQGRSDLFLGLEIIKKIIAVGPLCVGIFVGIMPMLYTNIVAGIIAYFLNSHYSGKFLNYSSWMQIKDISPSFGIGLLVSFSVFFMKFLPLSYWLILPLQLMTGFVVFLVFCRISKNEEFLEIVNILQVYLKRFNR